MKAWVNPQWRIWIFLCLTNAVWLVASWLWVERENWLWITPIALSINALILTYDQVLRFRALESQPLIGQDPWGILKLVNDLSGRLGVPTPKVFLLPQASAQIFSYARTQKNSRLYITEGALDLLTPRQLRAVLVFQMMTIRSSYNILNYWMAAILDLVFRFGKGLEKGCAFIFGWTPPLAAWLVSPWLAILHLFLLGSRDFRRLDRETAAHLEEPDDLAFALWKMESYAQTRPWPEAWTMAHMCMVSPLKLKGPMALLKVQPPLRGRIKFLTGRYPL